MGLSAWRPPHLTLVTRSSLLVAAELVANAVCWGIAAALLRRERSGSGKGSLLGLGILAWTLGLRHALDADHIAAIDNATRSLVSQGRLSITAGTFFSLGHSSIVVVVNIAIAASAAVYDNLGGVSSVGGIVGASVSASFLMLVAVLNSVVLYRIFRARRRQARNKRLNTVEPPEESVAIQGGGPMFRLFGRVLRVVDRSWKMYPVGVLFGFGFDTASSIALLGLTAVASDVKRSNIAILPFLFTCGMTLIDSLDGIMMIYAYARPGRQTVDGRLAFFQERNPPSPPLPVVSPELAVLPTLALGAPQPELDEKPSTGESIPTEEKVVAVDREDKQDVTARQARVEIKNATMSTLSIYLTLLSIGVAFSIALIEIMGLVGDNCAACLRAAEESSGLDGRWWRGWAKANDNSGYIGAAVCASFLAALLLSLAVHEIVRRRRRRSAARWGEESGKVEAQESSERV